jgi:3-hydroxybutyryl-CoA dehydrogenase
VEVKTIAVVGAGTMGRGIAYAAALGGYQTILEDVNNAVLSFYPSDLRDGVGDTCKNTLKLPPKNSR